MRRFPLLAVLALGLGFVQQAAAGDYPRGELLVEPAQLAGLRAVVLDVRDARRFEEARVPQARWVDVAEWSRGFGRGQDADGWSARLGALGIAADSTVVVYDDGTAKDAARAWWILQYWGVSDARLLNGGWSAWRKSGLAVETGSAAPVAATRFQARPQAARFATKQDVLDSLADRSLLVVDARSEGEHCGTQKLGNQRGGAIPGAKHLDWVELLDPQTQRFKSAAQIGKLFAAAQIDLDRPLAAHCQSGGRSSVMAFALELMGAKHVRNYYAGWSEWGNDAQTPIEPGQPKK